MSLIARHIWDIARKKEALWIKWVGGVYLKDREVLSYDPSIATNWH